MKKITILIISLAVIFLSTSCSRDDAGNSDSSSATGKVSFVGTINNATRVAEKEGSTFGHIEKMTTAWTPKDRIEVTCGGGNSGGTYTQEEFDTSSPSNQGFFISANNITPATYKSNMAYAVNISNSGADTISITSPASTTSGEMTGTVNLSTQDGSLGSINGNDLMYAADISNGSTGNNPKKFTFNHALSVIRLDVSLPTGWSKADLGNITVTYQPAYGTTTTTADTTHLFASHVGFTYGPNEAGSGGTGVPTLTKTGVSSLTFTTFSSSSAANANGVYVDDTKKVAHVYLIVPPCSSLVGNLFVEVTNNATPSITYYEKLAFSSSNSILARNYYAKTVSNLTKGQAPMIGRYYFANGNWGTLAEAAAEGTKAIGLIFSNGISGSPACDGTKYKPYKNGFAIALTDVTGASTRDWNKSGGALSTSYVVNSAAASIDYTSGYTGGVVNHYGTTPDDYAFYDCGTTYEKQVSSNSVLVSTSLGSNQQNYNSGWYLPSAGEFSLLFVNFGLVNNLYSTLYSFGSDDLECQCGYCTPVDAGTHSPMPSSFIKYFTDVTYEDISFQGTAPWDGTTNAQDIFWKTATECGMMDWGGSYDGAFVGMLPLDDALGVLGVAKILAHMHTSGDTNGTYPVRAILAF